MRSPEAGGMPPGEERTPEKKNTAHFMLGAAEWAAEEFRKLSVYSPHPSVELLSAAKFAVQHQRNEGVIARNKAQRERESAAQAREKNRLGAAAAHETRASELDEEAAMCDTRADALGAMTAEAEADVDALLGTDKTNGDKAGRDKKAPGAGASEISER